MSVHGQRTIPLKLERLMQDVVEVVHDMDRSGLTEGTAGNVSARTAEGDVVLTPTALRYQEMTTQDLIVCDLDGQITLGARLPTTEIDLHLACLRRHPEIRAVVHTHAIHASMFAVTQQPIPCVLEEFEYYVGGDVLVAPYHRTGTAELGDSVAALLGDRAAALIANHGLVVVGSSPEEALQLTKLVERAARIVWGARVLGTPIPLPDPIRTEFSTAYLERRLGAEKQ
jgi:L-fuculose-phosphate aldolase